MDEAGIFIHNDEAFSDDAAGEEASFTLFINMFWRYKGRPNGLEAARGLSLLPSETQQAREAQAPVVK